MEESVGNLHVELNELQHQSITPSEMACLERKDVAVATEEVIENPETFRILKTVAVQTYLAQEVVIPKHGVENPLLSRLIPNPECRGTEDDMSSQGSTMEVCSQDSLTSTMEIGTSQEASYSQMAPANGSVEEDTALNAIPDYTLPKGFSAKSELRKRFRSSNFSDENGSSENRPCEPRASNSLREDAVAGREDAVLKREEAVTQREEKVKMCEQALVNREALMQSSMTLREESMSLREKAMGKREAAFKARENEMKICMDNGANQFRAENGHPTTKRAKTEVLSERN